MNSEHAKLMKEARYERLLAAPIHVKCSEQGNRQGQKAAAREEGGGGIGSSCEQLELLRPVVPQPCEDAKIKKKIKKTLVYVMGDRIFWELYLNF